MELATRFFAFGFLADLGRALRAALQPRPAIERPAPGDTALLRDIGLVSFDGLRREERGYAGDLFVRYGKLD